MSDERANHTIDSIAQLGIARAEAPAGLFSVSGFSGQPSGNRTQQESDEEVQTLRPFLPSAPRSPCVLGMRSIFLRCARERNRGRRQPGSNRSAEVKGIGDLFFHYTFTLASHFGDLAH